MYRPSRLSTAVTSLDEQILSKEYSKLEFHIPYSTFHTTTKSKALLNNSEMDQRVQEAVKNINVTELHEIFSSSWQSLGQGEQKSLSANFLLAALNHPLFLSQAFTEQGTYDLALQIFQAALAQLPSTVEHQADNAIRLKLFDLLVELQDFTEAANILSAYRFDENEDSPYYSTPDVKTDIYVKIAECFLHEDEIVEADTFVSKAGAAVQALSMMNSMNNNQNNNNNNDGGGALLDDDQEHLVSDEHNSIILRYKSAHARVLDKNRKFLSAASRYYDLSALGSQTDIIDADDLVEFLGRAATCAMLAPSSSQRQRILGMVYNDGRLGQLDSLAHFATHTSILSKMYREQVIRRDRDLIQFEDSLGDHQKAIMGDGLTIFQRALIEHNMVAVSRIYSSIYFEALGQLLGLSTEKTEKVASKMILDGSLKAYIDQVDGVICFEGGEDGQVKKLVEFDGAITSFCTQLNSVVDAVRQNA
eukprot:scaffold3742_cov267-Chaetoceros_neogracile.AAC.18